MNSNWEVVRLAEVTTRRKEKVEVATAGSYRLMGVRWNRLGAYERGDSDSSPVKAKTMYRMRTGDFVFNRIDTDRGAFCVVGPALDGALASNEFPAYRALPGEMLEEFLWLHFQQDSVLSSIRPAGSEGRARWKETDFEDVELALPPLNEQRRIVDFIQTVDNAIDAAEQCLVEAEVVAERLRESLFQNPAATVQWSVGDLLIKHKVPVEVEPETVYTEIGIRSHNRGAFIKKPVQGAELGNKKVFHMIPGCIAFSVVFAWEGATAFLSAEVEGKIASHRFPNYKGTLPLSAELIAEFFKTSKGRQILVDCSPGGAGRNKTLNQSALLASSIMLPEQSMWGACWEQLVSSGNLVESATLHAASLRTLRSELLTALLSGTHTIPVSYDDVVVSA